jgi:hypothetical protein
MVVKIQIATGTHRTKYGIMISQTIILRSQLLVPVE